MSSPPAPEDPEDPPLFSRDFALILAIQLAFGFAFSSFFLLPKYVVQVLHGTPSQVGYVGATSVLVAVLVSPWCGKLLNNGRRRALMSLGCAMSAVGALGFLRVDAVGPYLYAVRAIQGASYTAYFVAATTLVCDISPAKRWSQALGWFGCAGLVMNAVSTWTAERIVAAYGWHAVFGVAAASGLLGAALSLAPREHTVLGADAASANAAVASSNEGTGGSIGASATAGMGHLGRVFWATACGGAAFGVLFTFTQPLALSLGETNMSPLFAGYTAAALLVRLAFGNLADRLGRARVGSGALAIYALVTATAAGLSRGFLGPLGVGFGLAHGAFYPSLSALSLEGVAPGARGRVSAYFNAAFNAGVLFVTFVFGQVAAAVGYRVIFLLVACLTATGCLSLMSRAKRATVLGAQESSP